MHSMVPVESKSGEETMSKQSGVGHSIYNLLPNEIEGFDSLAELAYALVVESCDRKIVAPARSGTVGNHTQSLGCPADRLAGPDQACVGRSGFSQKRRRLGADQAASGGGARVVSAESFAESPNLRRLFQHGVYVERSFAHLLGRPRQRRRRSAQSQQRSGRPSGRRRTAVSARLFSPGD